MGHSLLLLPFETLAFALAASAARLSFPSVATRTPTAEDGANAALLRPTPAPTAPTAPFPAAELLLLRGRDYTMGHDTCGFGSAQPWITYECYREDATCMNIDGYRGCCTSGSSSCSSTIWTTCEDYQSTRACGNDDHTRCCQSGAPYCVTWELKTDSTTYTAFDCDVDDYMPVREMLATPLELIAATNPGSTATKSSSPASSSGSMADPGGSISGRDDLDDLDDDDDDDDDGNGKATATPAPASGSGAPAGAIAGGVIGGLAAIGLVAGLVFFLRRRKRAAGAARMAARSASSPSPPPPPAAGPQEIATSDTRSPLGSSTAYSPDGGGGGHIYDPKTGEPIFEAPDTSVLSEAPDMAAVHEAPNTPARERVANRAELS